jgi:8-oxo-dGTP pyrophosphatase MutT (NUDIX family)
MDKPKVVRTGVGIAIFSTDNKLLLQLRSDNYRWGMLGGAVEFGEDIKTACVREVKEESGIIIDPTRLRFLSIYSNPLTQIVEYPDQIVHKIDILFYYDLIDSPITFNYPKGGETLSLRFIEQKELAVIEDNMSPEAREALSTIFQLHSFWKELISV